MTRKQLRGRLDRLELSARAKEVKREEAYKPPFDFPIDPAVVKVLQDEYAFLNEVQFSPFKSWTRGQPSTPEEIQTRARIAALASTIGCPPSYGFAQYWDDDLKINKWWGTPSQVSDLERAHVMARMEAYKQSPEGRARLRLDYLENGDGYRGLAAYEEMERLLKLYPEPWAQPALPSLVSSLLQKRGTPKDRKLRAEKHQRWINEASRNSKIKPKKAQLATQWYIKEYNEALLRPATEMNLRRKVIAMQRSCLRARLEALPPTNTK